MKPYNNDSYRDEVDMWDGMKADAENYYELNRHIRNVITETARDSQAQLREWVKGEVILSICALHPTERGWFVRSREKNGRIRKWILGILLKNRHLPKLGAALTGFPLEKVEKIIDRVNGHQGIDYFHESTWEEYEYLKSKQANPGPWTFSYQIINDYDEYLSVKAKGKQLAMIISVEGGHALTSIPNADWFNKPYKALSDDDKAIFTTSLKSNIQHLKGIGSRDQFNFAHTPFFVTLVHMYNNLLAGHAKSYAAGHGLIPGMDDLLYQSVGMNEGITEAGWLAIDQLLSRKEGGRILIDVKHLSMTARCQYYDYVEQKRKTGDHIPIIASHAAVNGYEKNDPKRKDNFKLDCNTYLSRWSINLSNEDIRAIHASDGIIGLVVHEGRMPGGSSRKKLKKLKKRVSRGGRKAYESQLGLIELYSHLILSNIFQIVLAIGDETAWDRIGIGSDYDGIMDPFNCYPKVGNFQELIADIGRFLEAPKDLKLYENNRLKTFSASQVSAMMYDLSPADIMKKISYGNAETFLSKYFTRSYLENN